MAKENEIKKNIKFYKKELEKWELRILISLVLIFLGIIVFYLEANNWDFTNIKFGTLEFPKLSPLTPFLFYLGFSAKQFNYYKKQLDLYKLKYTES
jgi:uncharacterized membrane protein